MIHIGVGDRTSVCSRAARRRKIFGDVDGASVSGLVTLNLELGSGLERRYRR